MTTQEGTSLRLSVNLADWINRCYSVYAADGNFELFMRDFSENICSFQGIFGAWVFQKSANKPGLKLVSFFSDSFNGDEKALLASFRRDFKMIAEPWKIGSKRYGKSQEFSGLSGFQPEDALRVYMISGLIPDGEIILVMVAESGLAQLINSTIPAMFRNIIEYSKLCYRNDDSDYRFLLENQNELVVKVDATGRFLFVSPTYCKLFGMTAQELLGSNFVPLIHPEDRNSTIEAMKQLNTYPYTCFLEQRAKTVMGWRWLAWSDKAIVDSNGNIGSIIGVGRDITDQKKIEQELLESENKFQKAFRSSPNLMSLSRLGDGLIYDVNDRFSKFLDLERSEIIGKKTRELGLFRTISRSKLMAKLQKEGKVENAELTLISRTGELIEGLFSVETIELNEEKCLVSSFQDITELKKVQAELEDYRLHLEGLVKQRTARIQEINDELGRFANSVCHDLKAPLRAMHGFANALAEDHAQNLDKEGKVYLNRICSASDQMETLINDLFQYSKLSSLELTLGPTDATKALNKVLIGLSDEINERKAIIKVKNELPFVIAYMPVLISVLNNLISNSLKFTEKGIIPVITINGFIKQKKALIRIKDNGIGIPEDKHKIVFDAFERLHGKESYPGNGIGLTIVKKAVERMGGSVSIISSPGKGSTFILKLKSVN
ncbi:MAG: PAS domain S-box protein [Lentimicrobium sp.]